MTQPFREHLETLVDGEGQWIRCTECSTVICRADSDWKHACQRRTFLPTSAGPLMSDLTDRYVFEKLYCPGCDVLLEADMKRIDEN